MPLTCQLLDRDNNRVVVEQLELATTFWRRFCGLQLRGSIQVNQGLLLTPCQSVHTMFCRFAIGITMLDADGVGLDRRCDVPPWRIVPPNRNAAFVQLFKLTETFTRSGGL